MSRRPAPTVKATLVRSAVQGCAMLKSSLRNDDQFAVGPPRAEGLERFGHPGERIAPADDGTNGTILVHSKERLHDFGHATRLVHGVGAPVEPDDGDVLQQNAVRLDLGDAAAREPDDEESPVPCDALERLIENVAA